MLHAASKVSSFSQKRSAVLTCHARDYLPWDVNKKFRTAIFEVPLKPDRILAIIDVPSSQQLPAWEVGAKQRDMQNISRCARTLVE